MKEALYLKNKYHSYLIAYLLSLFKKLNTKHKFINYKLECTLCHVTGVWS